MGYFTYRKNSIILAWLRVRRKAPASYSRYGRSLTQVSPSKAGHKHGSILSLRLKNKLNNYA